MQVDADTRQLTYQTRTRVCEGAVLTAEWAPDNRSIAVMSEVRTADARETQINVYPMDAAMGSSVDVQMRGGEMAALAWSTDSQHLLCCGPAQKLVRARLP